MLWAIFLVGNGQIALAMGAVASKAVSHLPGACWGLESAGGGALVLPLATSLLGTWVSKVSRV